MIGGKEAICCITQKTIDILLCYFYSEKYPIGFISIKKINSDSGRNRVLCREQGKGFFK